MYFIKKIEEYMNSNSSIGAIIFHLKKNLWLLLVLAVILWLRIYLWYDGISIEEAQTLVAAKVIFNGQSYSANTLLPSSPLPAVIMGLGELVYGFIGARILAAILGLVAIYFFFKFSYDMTKDNFASFLSTLLFAGSAPFIFISKMGSYDIVSLTLFTGFLYAFQKSYNSKNPSSIMGISTALLLFLSVISNLLLIFYVPIFIVLVLISKKRKAYFIPVIIIFLLTIIYILTYRDLSAKLTALLSANIGGTSISKLFLLILQYSIVPLLLFFTMFSERRKYPISLKIYYVLFLLALIIYILLLVTHNNILVFRSISFGLIFLYPLTGIMLKDFLQGHQNNRMAVVLVFLGTIALSFYQVSLLEKSYPDTCKLEKTLNENLTQNSIILAEDVEIYEYYFYPKLNLSRFDELKTGKSSDRITSEQSRIIKSVMDGAFDIIITDGLSNADFTQRIRDDIPRNYYRTIFSESYEISTLKYSESNGEITAYLHR